MFGWESRNELSMADLKLVTLARTGRRVRSSEWWQLFECLFCHRCESATYLFILAGLVRLVLNDTKEGVGRSEWRAREKNWWVFG
eukprot:562082-Pleurochrysis_carterae.AAC.1